MKNIIDAHVKHKVLGIDSSTFSIANTLVVDGEIKATTKIDLGKGELPTRLYKARRNFPGVLRGFAPDLVAVEQSIYVQSADAVRKLSYIIGIIMAETLVRDIEIVDVPPMQWKSFIGVKALTASRKNEIIKELGEKEGRKHITSLKKTMVQDVLRTKFPAWGNVLDDNDIADATAIALFAYHTYGSGRPIAGMVG